MSSTSSFNSILSYDGSTDDPDYLPSGGETECFFELDLDDETMDEARKKSCSSRKKKSDECRGKKSAETKWKGGGEEKLHYFNSQGISHQIFIIVRGDMWYVLNLLNLSRCTSLYMEYKP